MPHAEVLGRLAGLLDSFETHRNFIDRAREQAAAGKFSAAVVEKVVLDHEVKCAGISDEVGPLLPSLSAARATLHAQRDEIMAGRGGIDERIQEFELRALIGEMSEADLEREVGELRATQANANERIAGLDAEVERIDAGLARWSTLAARAGRSVSIPVAAPVVAPAPVAAPAAPEPPAPAVVVPSEPVAAPSEPEIEVAPAPVATPEVDLGDLFDDAPVVGVSAPDEEVSVSLTPEPVEEDAIEIEVAAVQAPIVDVDVDVAVEESDSVSGMPGEEPLRRALLVLNENSEDEVAYPFENDDMWIGRSKECAVQLKADPKVSRQHCRLYRRGNQFFIEDNNSTNSTLVNRELITERRLYGGEEISVGESQFRFRIID